MGALTIKILVLVIASDNFSIYCALEQIWQSYMHLDPAHVEAYFLKGDPNMSVDAEIRGDVIWCKTEENLIPGILNKTILAMEAMLPRLSDFDFVIRTNLSSFYVFPRLLSFLDLLTPPDCFYASCLSSKGIIFGSGAGIILSIDLMKHIVDNKSKLLNQTARDDMILGSFMLKQSKKNIISASRMDFMTMEAWMKDKDSIPDYIYHFRCKNENPDLRMSDELYIHKELVKMFYLIERI